VHTAGAGGLAAGGSTGTHDALLYRNTDEYVEGVLAFLEAGLSARDPLFVAVPASHIELLRPRLPADVDGVQFADMTAVGRNPACIIPAIAQFLDAHPASRVRFVGEPIWPGRSPAEICEATRHEAMLNTVFGATDVDILCPYDVTGLDPATVADAWRTHPTVIDQTGRRESATYENPARMYDPADPLLPPAPEEVEAVQIQPGALPLLRDAVRTFAREVGLAADATRDLVLAANEIATNTLMHTTGPGSLRIWRSPTNVICEIRDGGHIADPLAGRHRPAVDGARGRGLWMANHLCDLVQLRSTEGGTVVRLSMDDRGA
jgi:anti-sigma regulatory factor (Ser/Thr protein kinase)